MSDSISSDPQHDAEDVCVQQRLKEHGNMPLHIAIIMDGDRRWAKERNLPVAEGHRHGRETAREIVRASSQLGVEVLTLYTFSTENWRRSKFEVSILMRWLRESLIGETPELNDNNVRLNAIGRIDGLPKSVQRALEKALTETASNTGLLLNIAVNYGGRSEIVDACRSLAEKVRSGELAPDEIDEDLIGASLYTGGIPDPDLLIRCSGEMRTSNFLPWQMVYTEIWFTPVFWPEFRRHNLYEAITAYQQRQRRFGGA